MGASKYKKEKAKSILKIQEWVGRSWEVYFGKDKNIPFSEAGGKQIGSG